MILSLLLSIDQVVEGWVRESGWRMERVKGME